MIFISFYIKVLYLLQVPWNYDIPVNTVFFIRMNVSGFEVYITRQITVIESKVEELNILNSILPPPVYSCI
jgi:hypothetical protein